MVKALPVAIKLDGTMVLVIIGIGAAIYIYNKKEAIVSAINPADPQNVINQAVTKAVGQENIATAADYGFGAFDLLNPFASQERKNYAKLVYGIETQEEQAARILAEKNGSG